MKVFVGVLEIIVIMEGSLLYNSAPSLNEVFVEINIQPDFQLNTWTQISTQV